MRLYALDFRLAMSAGIHRGVACADIKAASTRHDEKQHKMTARLSTTYVTCSVSVVQPSPLCLCNCTRGQAVAQPSPLCPYNCTKEQARPQRPQLIKHPAELNARGKRSTCRSRTAASTQIVPVAYSSFLLSHCRSPCPLLDYGAHRLRYLRMYL